MEQSYINCLKKLRKFRKRIQKESDLKIGKLYFSWIATKTEKILNEKNKDYIYENLVKYTLENYKIDKYTYERLNKKEKQIVNDNYIEKNNYYVFENSNISKGEVMYIVKNILLKRGNVVWIDFGFNIGNEFGGMHPAIILKNFDTELLVLPVSSKKPKEYIKLEQKYIEGNITFQEYMNRKTAITDIVQLDRIYRFKNMTRWANITRIRKASILRLNFEGTIGKIDGKYLNIISKKISIEF